MKMPDRPRQVMAGALATIAFLCLYLGMNLVLWLALLLAITVYGAALLLIQRRRPLEEIQLGDGVSAGDITAVALDDASKRLDRAANRAPIEDAGEIAKMATHVVSIRRSMLKNPETHRPVRRFTTVYLPHIVKCVETYVQLAAQTGDRRTRLHDVSGQIKRFGEVLERIEVTCIENDLRALDVELDVLSSQLDRTRG